MNHRVFVLIYNYLFNLNVTLNLPKRMCPWDFIYKSQTEMWVRPHFIVLLTYSSGRHEETRRHRLSQHPQHVPAETPGTKMHVGVEGEGLGKNAALTSEN